MRDLFTPVSRDERQDEGVQKWINNKCKGTLEWATGTGKTIAAIKAVNRVLKKYPNFKILVIVPTDALVDQWKKELSEKCATSNYGVNTINSAVTHTWTCDILILDECHRLGSEVFSKVFTCIKYRLILGLTATMQRLDEKHTLIEKYCPIIDSIPLEVAIQNGWVSSFTEYKVYIDTDLSQYKEMNKEFTEHFSFFNYDWNLAVSMLGPEGFKARIKYRDQIYTGNDPKAKSDVFKNVTYHATGLMRTVKQRKEFIYTHPDKIRLAREIIKYRPNSKIVTFSATTKIAESIGIGYVYTGKDSKKKGRTTIEEFSKLSSGVINTVKKFDEGMDIPGLNVAIMLGIDSSRTRATQRTGRVIRKEPGKQVEIFTFVIRGTVEEEWYNNSHPNTSSVVTIDEENLMHVLRGEPYEQYKRKPMKMTFRF